jgi:Cys-tRNA(Pro)/Cys-tRNA(Cys) deacylase
VHPKVAEVLCGTTRAYKEYRHADFAEPIKTAADFAVQLKYDLDRISKSLFVRCVGGSLYAMVVAPMGKKVDLSRLAAQLGCKRVEVAPAADLHSLTGYPPNGVSPLGIAAGIPVVIDDSLFAYDTILVGGGEAGVEIELSPADLLSITNASRGSLIA